jgi:hypothetical protein
MTMFLSRKGEPMELMEWAVAYEDPAIRTVAIDIEEDIATMVSTIWEGMVGMRPGTFETGVLVKGEMIDLYRWHSEEEAVAGHAEICRAILGREPRPEDGWLEKRVEAG